MIAFATLHVGQNSSSANQGSHSDIGSLDWSSVVGLCGRGSGSLTGRAGKRGAELGDVGVDRGGSCTGGSGGNAAEGAELGAGLGGQAGDDAGGRIVEDGFDGAGCGAGLGFIGVDFGLDVAREGRGLASLFGEPGLDVAGLSSDPGRDVADEVAQVRSGRWGGRGSWVGLEMMLVCDDS